MAKTVTGKEIRLGYRLQNSSIQRNSERVKHSINASLDTLHEAACKNIQDTKDIVQWNADRFRVFEISNIMLPLQNHVPQLAFARNLTSELTNLHIWSDHYKQRIVIQTKPIRLPVNQVEAKNLLDYLESLAFIAKILQGTSILLNFTEHETQYPTLAKFFMNLGSDLKQNFVVHLSDENYDSLYGFAKELGLKLSLDMTKVLKHYADKPFESDPLAFWLRKAVADLIYISSDALDGVGYLEYAKIRKEIYYTKNNHCDIIIDSPLREVNCQSLMRDSWQHRPSWGHTVDKRTY